MRSYYEEENRTLTNDGMTLNNPITREMVQQRLGIEIGCLDFYVQACTHKSVARDGEPSYERLEFLGDSVLNFIVTRYLYERFPTSTEGFLTRIRTKVVSGKTLSELSSDLGLPELLVMNERANRSGWRNNPRIQEDVYEALLGAMYLDLGLMVCRQWVYNQIDGLDWEAMLEDTNHKDILMRTCQAHAWDLPEYRLVDTSGPDHQTTFDVEVWIKGRFAGRGSEQNKKAAEQSAACAALRSLRGDGFELPLASSSLS